MPDLLDELLELATTLAARATDMQLEGLRQGKLAVATKSSSTDMVTEVDRATEQLIVEGLQQTRPDDAIVGEEGADRPGTSGVRWLIDPIDGTTNYVYGHAGFAVSIGADVDGVASVGVVHDPLHGDLFRAIRGRGATRNGRPVQVNDVHRLSTSLVATGFAYDPERRRRQAALLSRVIPLVRDVRRMGAASVDLCSVACGRVDAYYEHGLGPWDLAAGALIASEAGARVGDLAGGPVDGTFVLAAPPGLFEPLRDLLAQMGAGQV
ncbi:MAG: inositol monophosphatase family protein [Acidimicrobiia bacterium]